MTPIARITALYQQGRFAEGQRLNVAVAVSRGGSIESGGAVKASPRGNGPGLPTSHGQGSSARSLAPAGTGLLPQRMTAPVPAGDEQGPPLTREGTTAKFHVPCHPATTRCDITGNVLASAGGRGPIGVGEARTTPQADPQ